MADVEPLPKFPSPFVDGESVSMARFEPEEMEEMMLPDARTALERKLDTFTCTIREKPLWWEKVFKDDIVERWKTEALQQDVGSDMFDFGVQQLRHQARQCGDDGVRPSPVAGVFESDAALGSGLQQQLLAALQPLRDVPDDQKDWHPGSEQQVLDLVHPSLFPLTYGLSRRLKAAAPGSEAQQGTGQAQGSSANPSVETLAAAASASGAPPTPPPAAPPAGARARGPGQSIMRGSAAAAANATSLTARTREECAATAARAESWFSPGFGAWKTQMGGGEVIGADEAPGPTRYESAQFQWLPAEVLVGADGRVVFDSYVNNMHPERHAALYAATARLLGRMLPLLERTLSTAAQRPQRVFIVSGDNDEWWSPASKEELWEDMKASGEAERLLRQWHAEHAAAQHNQVQHSEAHPPAVPGEAPAEADGARVVMDVDIVAEDGAGAGGPEPAADQSASVPDDSELPEGVLQMKHSALYDLLQERRVWAGPWLPDEFEPLPPPPRVDLRGRNLQVIVKYAEIVLTPERPEYGGGVWHVEGMENEAIAASCIAYLAAENISDSRLHFRTMVADPDYEQNDDDGTKLMYDMVRDGPMNEPLGSVLCAPGRMLCWPNAFQHRVAPFRLADASRPGRRTIAVAFLVDPKKRVLSTRDVPPQQMEWHDAASRLGSLVPEEVKRKVDALREFPVSLARAKELRLELMEERRTAVSELNEDLFEREFSLCEH